MNLDSLLDRLESGELIRRLSDPDPAYSFKHTLTQVRAYESLLVKRRRDLHARVAAAYEELYPDRLEEFAPLLARHYLEAGDAPRTLHYATRAGDAAARVYAHSEAIANYDLALDAADRMNAGSAERRHLWLARGRALELSARYADALASYQVMETHARAGGDAGLELAALLAQATILSRTSALRDIDRAQAICDRALETARELGDKKSQARLLWNLMLLYHYGRHEPQTAAWFGEQALHLYREPDLADDREGLAYTLNDRGYVYFQLGDLTRALDSFKEAEPLWEAVDNRPMLTDCLAASAVLLLMIGQVKLALARVELACAINYEIANSWGICNAEIAHAFILEATGQTDAAIGAASAAIHYGDQAGATSPAAVARVELASLTGRAGDIERAIELGHAALAYAGAHFPEWRLWAQAGLARLYLRAGRLVDAEAVFPDYWPSDLDRHFGLFFMPGAVLILLTSCELALARHDHALAQCRIQALQERITQIGCVIYLPQVQELAASLAYEPR